MRLKPSAVIEPTRRANRKALAQLFHIWSLGKTGYLVAGDEKFVLLHGEPANDRDLNAIVRLAHKANELEFLRVGHEAAPVPPKLANELWQLALGCSAPKDLRGTATETIRPGRAFARRNALPLARETLSLLANEFPRVGDTIRLERDAKVRVLTDLAALRVLGVIRIPRRAR